MNYGQLLQAYGTAETVKSFGYNCEIINIQMNRDERAFFLKLLDLTIRFFTRNPLNELGKVKKKLIENAFQSRYEAELSLKMEKFDLFRERKLPISASVYSGTEDITANPPVYDAYICGSDQIWNPNYIFRQKYHEYFLSFAPQKKRVAYAPSFGIQQLPSECIVAYREWISQIPYLSCREVTGVEIIKNLTGRDAVHVLDPTLLLGQEQRDELIREVDTPNYVKPYILCYILGVSTSYEFFLESSVAELGYQVVTLPMLSGRKGYENTNCFDAGPAEFVSLIRHADYVITDSFHGIVFSMIYNRPFAVFHRKDPWSRENQMFSRILSLLSLCKIEPPLMNESSVFDRSMLDIDFTIANEVLQREIDKSKQYLSDSLKKACES